MTKQHLFKDADTDELALCGRRITVRFKRLNAVNLDAFYLDCICKTCIAKQRRLTAHNE